MSRNELNETLKAIGRSQNSEHFKRDTPMLLKALDNLELINRRIKNLGHTPERRKGVQNG